MCSPSTSTRSKHKQARILHSPEYFMSRLLSQSTANHDGCAKSEARPRGHIPKSFPTTMLIHQLITDYKLRETWNYRIECEFQASRFSISPSMDVSSADSSWVCGLSAGWREAGTWILRVSVQRLAVVTSTTSRPFQCDHHGSWFHHKSSPNISSQGRLKRHPHDVAR